MLYWNSQIIQEPDCKFVAATHPNLKFLVQLVVNIYGGGQERVTTLGVYSLQQNMLEALSWFGEAFHPVVLEIEIDGIMNTESFDLPCGKHLICN